MLIMICVSDEHCNIMCGQQRSSVGNWNAWEAFVSSRDSESFPWTRVGLYVIQNLINPFAPRILGVRSLSPGLLGNVMGLLTAHI